MLQAGRRYNNVAPRGGQGIEIERKFLLKRLPKNLEKYRHHEIEQGYLAVERRSGVQVRLRRKGSAFSLSCKREGKKGREEREITLRAAQFRVLWPATEGRRLSKIRYEVPWKSFTVEIDVYRGRHEGVIVAEVEFESEKSRDAFVPPEWFGREVTGEARYSNVVLALS